MLAGLDLKTRLAVVPVSGSLRAPVNGQLGTVVASLVRCGERQILLDLAKLRDIDAAGVGELACAFAAARTAGGALRIARANRYVRCLLDLAGLYALLTTCEQP